ncbi:Planctomycete cytochrome C [Rubripirellula amarantea]|uniref:Planctomycete cytochrome C n=1 Tax=Rubripirellula amarantea TaxID=2527999 RepID=A0A5C5WDD2_9BACT|nr:PSD1 and planctomycete cytochrome C domain-containing protein [Rubripirellula amarantea]TWT48143.1 Planctomycete cytochrome C [Rubripirellula amarantea]
MNSCAICSYALDRIGVVLATLMTLVCCQALDGHAADAIPDNQLTFFESKVRPLLNDHCYECHSREFDEASGGLRLDTAEAIAKGGLGGTALVAGHPDQSLIMEVVSYESEMQMPPDGKLDDEMIAILRQWIEMGAPDPRHESQESQEEMASPLERDPQTHWAFIPPQAAHAAKQLADDSRDIVDDLASEVSVAEGVSINERADDSTLIRRLYFDLSGLPPTAEDVQDYCESTRPDKFTRLVDQLLAAPEFGERFGRHWLDVARYADTIGYATAGKERRYPGSHRYRDWVIRAIGQDMPYDEMVRHQLTGDRTDPNNEQGNLDAMGFLTLGRKFLNGLDRTDDQIDVITRGLLGMTVTCARCHDHKFDPIPTTDYYALFGVLQSSEQPESGPSPLMMVDREKTGDRPVFLRGQLGNRGPIAPRQFLTALRKPDEPRFHDGSGRKELADRITRADNPLFARVMVNRVWTHLIGRPLVDSPSDFGFRTQQPKVPQVLDDLATDFARDFSIKRLVRRIVSMRVYQQSSSVTSDNLAKDPNNECLSRANRRRRDLESLRDSMLCVSDSLDRQLGGEPVEISLPSPVARRTVYALIDRQNLPSLFRTFDFPDPNAHSPGRYFTTVPQQGLFLLNSPQVAELAKRTANRVRASVVGGNESNLDKLAVSMFQQVLGRTPNESEQSSAVNFLQQEPRPLENDIDPQFLWTYGTARLARADGQSLVSEFRPFGVFKGDRWQPQDEFPVDGDLGFSFVANENGHSPRDPTLATVRRFTAPDDGNLRIAGQMGHRAEEGDGVAITILIGGKEYHHSVEKSSNRPFGPYVARIKKGETVDVLAACGKTDSFDSFFFRGNLRLTRDDKTTIETNSVKHFSGSLDPPSTEPLDRLSQLAQVLIISNEFAFVD